MVISDRVLRSWGMTNGSADVTLMRALTAGYRWLRDQLSACWRDPSATPELAAKYRGRQYQSISQQLPLCALAATSAAGLVYMKFAGQIGASLWFYCVVLTGVTQSISLGYWWLNRSAGGRGGRKSHRAIWEISIGIMVAALTASLMFVDLFGIADERGRLWVTAVAAAFIATGGWLFATVPYAGLSWVLTLCGVMSVAFFTKYREPYGFIGGLLLFYAVVISLGVLMTSRAFIRRLMAETEIEKQRQLVGLLLNDFEENASDWLWETDSEGRLVHVSARLAQAIAVAPDALQGRRLVEVLAATFPSINPQEQAELAHLSDCLAQRSPFRDAVVPVMVHGQRQWWSWTAKPLLNAASEIVGWRGVGSDITAVRQRDIDMARLANLDSLTGLANRHQFSERLSAQFSGNRSAMPCTLLLLDLDNFKNVNDTLGHSAGDLLLKQVAARLVKVAASHGLLARLGGDEFALLVQGRMADEAVQVLGRRMLAAVDQTAMLGEHLMEVHASIGVGFAPDDAQCAEDLLKVSDMALYAAKGAGRNTLRLFDREMALDARRKLELLRDMHEGMERGEFFVAYQPQIELNTGRIVGFEALMRWRHPVRGFVSPAEFIPIAEDSGLIVPLGAWILDQACEDALSWPTSMSVSVNVSAAQFARSNLIDVVTEALARSGLPVSRLELELTESTLMRNSDEICALLTSLRQSGVRIALDDFGTGYSSLSYLRQFPLDKLKIDQSFVRSMGDDGMNQRPVAIIQAITQLAHALELETTAEGVETEAQRDALRSLGCISAQGYLYAKPMDAARTLTYIEESEQSESGEHIEAGAHVAASA